MLIFAGGTLLIAVSLGKVGPGLGEAGVIDNCAHFPPVGKWILSFFMLLGRLELYTLLILFVPVCWRC